MILKCQCQNCGVNVEFPSEYLGTSQECPECHKQTLLVELKPPADAQPKQTQIVASKTGSIFLHLIGLANLVALGFICWIGWQILQAQRTPTTWDYAVFTFDGTTTMPDNDAQLCFRWGDLNGLDAANVKYGWARRIFNVDDILSAVGEDGWELSWKDGNDYIVRRPNGNWKHDFFSVQFLKPQDQKQ
jgi:hypothetical protein